MNRTRKLLALVVAVVCIGWLGAGAPVAAQFANADLGGRVVGPDGNPLPGVTVTATHEETAFARTSVTGASGRFSLNGLRPGRYTVAFELEGFKTASRERVQLLVGQETTIDAELELGTVEEAITVTGGAAVIETTSKEIGGTITDQEFQVLPSANRSALLFASLLPGVVPDPSVESTASDALFVNGQDDNNNSFNFDGANNDDDVIGARAGAQARTPIEAIQEFQVLTTQFDAEFGRSVGGVLNAVTKSGGNDFHGAAWFYRQDSSLNEKDFLADEKPDEEFTDRGFNVGGPIVSNKAFFFVNYDDIQDQAGVVGNFPTRPEFDFSTAEDNQIENVLGKVDYTPINSQQLSFRWLREESPQFNQIFGVNPPGQQGLTPVTLNASREESDIDSNWVFNWTSVVGSGALNVARLSFTKEDVAFANPAFNNNGGDFDAQRNQRVLEVHPSFADGGSDVAQARINRSTQLDDTFSFLVTDWAGDHDFRVGFNYSDREEEFTNFGALNGIFYEFESDVPFDSGDISTYPGAFLFRAFGGATAEIPNNETLGVFAQDDWQVGPNLTVNLGVRYDEEDITDDTNVAPRLGFAWDPFGQGTSVVRGGYGRFYDRFQLGFFAGFFLDAVDLPQGFVVTVPDSGINRQLFFDLAQANGVTTLDGLRDAVIGAFEGQSVAPLNTFPTVDNPDRKQAYVDSFSIGFEKEQWRGVSWAVDLVHSENRDTVVAVDLNPVSRSQGGRPNISILNGETVSLGSVTTFVNAGENDYDALQLSLSKRFDGRWGGRLALTLADSEGNNDGGGAGTAGAYFQTRTESGYNFDTGTFIGEPLDLNLDDPRSSGVPLNWQRDEHLAVSGQYLVPGTSWRESDGLIVAGIVRYLSGDKFTIFTSELLDNNNQAIASADTYGAINPGVDYGLTAGFDGKLRGADNPSFFGVDLSLRYRIPFGGRYSVEILGDVFNVFDRVNWVDNGGNRLILDDEGEPISPQALLVPTATQGPRRFQLGARFSF